MESCPDFVYLSRVYAGYFGACAMGEDDTKVGFIRVDASALKPELLFPDEDAIEQVSRGQIIMDFEDEFEDPLELKRERTAHIRDNPDEYQHLYGLSLAVLGNVAFNGIITPDMITGVRIVDLDVHKTLGWAMMDPTISMANYGLAGHQHDALTRWVFGEVPTEEDVYGYVLPPSDEIPSKMSLEEGRNRHMALYSDHSGIEVLR
jgi:hypothetical protein